MQCDNVAYSSWYNTIFAGENLFHCVTHFMPLHSLRLCCGFTWYAAHFRMHKNVSFNSIPRNHFHFRSVFILIFFFFKCKQKKNLIGTVSEAMPQTLVHGSSFAYFYSTRPQNRNDKFKSIPLSSRQIHVKNANVVNFLFILSFFSAILL